MQYSKKDIVREIEHTSFSEAAGYLSYYEVPIEIQELWMMAEHLVAALSLVEDMLSPILGS